VERGISFFEGLQVDRFVVGRVVVPAADHDALPFEGERAGDGVALQATLLELVVIGAGPAGKMDAFECVLVKGLADEVRTGATAHDLVSGQAGALEDGSDAAEALQFARVGETGAVVPECSQKARGQDRTNPGKGKNERVIGMRGKDRGDLRVVAVNGGDERFELAEDGPEIKFGGAEDGGIIGQRSGVRVDFLAAGERFLPAAVVAAAELFHGGPVGGLKLLQRRPTAQELDGERGGGVFARHVQRLGVIVFEEAGEFVAPRRAVVDQAAALFDQSGELAHGRRVGQPRGEFFPVRADEIGDPGCIGGIILGPGKDKGLAVVFERRGIDRIELHKIEAAEEHDQVGGGLLETNTEQVQREPPTPLRQPRFERRRARGQAEGFSRSVITAEGEVEVGVRAVATEVVQDRVSHGDLLFSRVSCTGQGSAKAL